MSHLRKHQNKEIIKKVLFFLIGIALLGFFAFQSGLKSIINATLFLNTAISGTSETEYDAASEDFLGILTVDEPPHATSSSEIIISGVTTDFEKLDFYINNTKVSSIPAKESFEEKIGKLKVGENTVSVIAQTKNGKNKKESEKYTVYYKNEPPELEITAPKNGDTVTKQDIQFEGKTDPGVTISVNNLPVVVNYEGNFKKSMRLKEGDNRFIFRAKDEAGNTEETEITVKYERED